MKKLERLGIKAFNVPSVTLSQIRKLEGRLNTLFPQLYVELLLWTNGGMPTVDTLYVVDEEYIVNDFFFLEKPDVPSANDYLATEGALWNYHNMKSILTATAFPFGRDPSDNFFYFDLTKGESTPVYYWQHDSPDKRTIEIASTFEIFIDSLSEPFSP